MPLAPRRLLALIGLALLSAPAAAQAQSAFEISLGGDRLGRITHERSGATSDLVLTLDSTPFGVFDGSYAGRSVTGGEETRHSGRTRSSRKSRDLSMRLEDGLPREVTLLPESERTALSAARAITAPVVDPVRAFGRLVEASSCPAGLRIYDGRRVGLLETETARREGARVTCSARYRVSEGPGYLAPLGLSRFAVTLVYDASAAPWRLLRIGARSGPFGLSLDREAGR